MSRPPFWQPGDRWQPPITRIHGVEEGTPEALALMRRHEGAVKQFYLGQARAHALGIVDNSRGRRQLPGVTMQYTNMYGQEILDVTFAPEYVAHAKAVTESRMLPDWLVVEFRVEDGSRIQSMFGAYARTPSWLDLDLLQGGTLRGTNLGSGRWGQAGAAAYTRDGRLASGMSWQTGAPIAVNQQVERYTPHRNTFVVDLRQLRSFPVLVFDFYGWIESVRAFPVISYYTRADPIYYVAEYDSSWSGSVTYDLAPLGGGPGTVLASTISYFAVGSDYGQSYSTYQRAWETAHPNTPIPPLEKDDPNPIDYWEYLYNSGDGSTVPIGGGNYTVTFSRYWVRTVWEFVPVYILDVEPRDVAVTVNHRIFSGGDLGWAQVEWLRQNDGPVPFPEAPYLDWYPYDQEYNTWERADIPYGTFETFPLGPVSVDNFTPDAAPSPNTSLKNHYFGTYSLVQEEWAGSWTTPGPGT